MNLEVTCFPVTTASKVKANGVLTVDKAIKLKYILMQGPTDLFVSWAGGKAYKKKDGTNGWDSPIFIEDKATEKSITEMILNKYKSVSGGKVSSPAAQSNDASFAADDIPF
jgi:DNA-binding cell septation regulator SpoVG